MSTAPHPAQEHAPPAAAAYQIEPAHIWEVLTLHRLERQIFRQDTYNRLEMLLLFLLPGLINLKLVGPDGQAVGFVSGGQVIGGKTWIITIGIHPDHRRRGLGRRLLRAIEARLDGHDIYLTVRVSNVGAIQLYESEGYRLARRKYGYYPARDGQSNETGLEMVKKRSD